MRGEKKLVFVSMFASGGWIQAMPVPDDQMPRTQD